MFILLAAWRKTTGSSAQTMMADRMAATFADAGVSITVWRVSARAYTCVYGQVTSTTSALSFAVGCFATFPSVQIFCVYATVAVVFVYVYQLTFFAGTCSNMSPCAHH